MYSQALFLRYHAIGTMIMEHVLFLMAVGVQLHAISLLVIEVPKVCEPM